MRIEKVNENQIRCTLTREDLASRHIKLSELAYGSDNAKSLFRDMMHQAAVEHGFEADDIPLMIEAIPLSSETIMLIITKVESPEELDTRFSNFTDASGEDDSEETAYDGDNPFEQDRSKEILELFEQIRREKEKSAAPKEESSSDASDSSPSGKQLTKMFSFQELDTAFHLAGLLKDFYTGDNALYKNPKTNLYYLVIRQGAHSLSEFHKIYNTVSEYTRSENYTPGLEAFYKEHCKIILAEKALQKLSDI